MNRQPDKLFRNKLYGYQQPVSSGAWNRISEGLARKNRQGLRLRVAATVLLLATSGIFIYPALRNNATDPGALTKRLPNYQGRANTTTAPSASAISDTPADGNHNIGTDDGTPSPAVTQRADRTHARGKQTRPLQKNTYPSTQPAVEIPSPVTDIEKIDTINDDMITWGAGQPVTPISDQQTSVDQPIGKINNIRIVFTAEEVNEKYLRKITDAKATLEAEETSMFKKLLDKALDLKNNQNLLGDLRQRKDEIFATNFKNQNERKEND